MIIQKTPHTPNSPQPGISPAPRPRALQSGRHFPPSASLRLCVSYSDVLQRKGEEVSSILQRDGTGTHLPLPPCVIGNLLCNKKLEFSRIFPTPHFFGATANGPSGTRESKLSPCEKNQRKPPGMSQKGSHTDLHKGLDLLRLARYIFKHLERGVARSLVGRAAPEL